MAYPPSFLDRLRSQVLLSELIGARIPLRKAGREWSGRCPFHQEKSPSFTVNNEKSFYHCFGCGAHGDAIEFLKQYEHLTYPEAVEKLAGLLGISVPERTPAQAERASREKSLHAVMEEACKWFESELRSARGLAARQYLEARGLTPETAKGFRLGFAPDSRDALKRALLAKGVTEAQMSEAGLTVTPQGGAAYDRFRARLIFPIRDAGGRVIAFGGRILTAPAPGRHVPKYLNSPETPLFKKGEQLYNLDQAARAARDKGRIVLVEGYMDAVSAAQAGIPETAAPLGTAVTPEQLKRLWQYADAPVLCLDGDAAGLRASLRAAETALPLLTPGKTLRFALLPAGSDPDSLIKEYGVQRFEDCLIHARELHDMLWTVISAQYSSPAPTTRAALEKRLTELTETIQDATTRAHFRAYFREKIWQRPKPAPGGKGKRPLPGPQARSPQLENLAQAQDTARLRTARQIFALLLMQPRLLQDGETETVISRLECANPLLERLRQALLDALYGGLSAEELVAHLEQAGFTHAVASLLKDEAEFAPQTVREDMGKARKWLTQLTQAYDLCVLEAEYQAVEAELSAAPDGGGEVLYARLMALQKELRERKAERMLAYPAYGEEG